MNGILESARLWPTTPVILRESTIATRWHGTWLPENTEFEPIRVDLSREALHIEGLAVGLLRTGGFTRN